MTLPIRARLTLWYSVMLTIILVAFAAGVYAFVGAEERGAVDRILRERAESFANALSDEQGEPGAITEIAKQYARGEGDVLVYDSGGNLVFSSPRHLLQNAPAHPTAGTFTLGNARYIAAPAGKFLFVSAESLAGRDHALDRLRRALLALIPIAILFAALCGYFLADRSLKPLDAAHLALERSLQQQKQLLADTSHELRTPVTIIRSEAEVTLSREREAPDYRRSLEVIHAESSHLTNLIEGVLLLARAGEQQGAIEMSTVQLAEIVDDCVRAMQRVAQSRQISLTCTTDGAMPLHGSGELLRRMLLNLVDNAIKFCDAGGWVCIDARRDSASYIVRIADNGRGIPAQVQDKIFDRFFRADDARAHNAERDTGGAGLGLPIAQWIARAHGGELRLLRSSPSGSVFEVQLPINLAAAS